MADNTNTAQALADECKQLHQFVLHHKEQSERHRSGSDHYLAHMDHVRIGTERLHETLARLASLASQAAEQEPVAHLWRYRNPKHCRPQGWNIGRPEWADEEVEVIAVVPAGTAPVREQSERDAELLDALADYLEKQDALDDREISGPNAEDYFKLVSRRNTARDFLDAAIAAKKEQHRG